MYVKLAFAVAAHLDSEILVMDEVLAVGDVKFQQKCLGKMSDVSKGEGRTVLYVSHNMNTIRQLCDRCIVLDHGKLIFDGDVEEAIEIYSEVKNCEQFTKKDLRNAKRYMMVENYRMVSFTELEFLNVETNVFEPIETLKVKLTWEASKEIEGTCIRMAFRKSGNVPVAATVCLDIGKTVEGSNCRIFDLPIKYLVSGKYDVALTMFEKNIYGTSTEIDVIPEAFSFEILTDASLTWSPTIWGNIRLPDMKCQAVGEDK